VTPPAPDAPPLREIIARHRLSARASLGQHFLLDYNLTRRIARAAGDLSGQTVFEIGPGPGGLTRALLESAAAKVITIERDRRCIAILNELAAEFPARLEIIDGDALTTDLVALAPPPRSIVANLPYNISTKLLTNWLADATAFQSMTLMFQKEVAQRLVAAPGSRSYGRLSVLCQWLCDVRSVLEIPPAAFTPPPKVASTVVALQSRAAPLAPADPICLQKITAAAFGQRRKMLRSSLKQVFANPIEILTAVDIDPATRAEQLSVDQFCALARKLEAD